MNNFKLKDIFIEAHRTSFLTTFERASTLENINLNSVDSFATGHVFVETASAQGKKDMECRQGTVLCIGTKRFFVDLSTEAFKEKYAIPAF